MQKIEIDIIDKKDLLEKFNTKKVSKDLINYLIDTTSDIKKEDKVTIIINNYLGDENLIRLIKEGLKVEYEKCLKKHFVTYLRKFLYFILGIIAIFVSTLFETEVLHEIILIGGWVLIWEMVELEIFTDRDNYKKRKILKKLLESEFKENKIENKKSTFKLIFFSYKLLL